MLDVAWNSERARWMAKLLFKITINPIYARTFMIATEQEEIFRVFNFVSEKKANRFQALFSCEIDRQFRV